MPCCKTKGAKKKREAFPCALSHSHVFYIFFFSPKTKTSFLCSSNKIQLSLQKNLFFSLESHQIKSSFSIPKQEKKREKAECGEQKEMMISPLRSLVPLNAAPFSSSDSISKPPKTIFSVSENPILFNSNRWIGPKMRSLHNPRTLSSNHLWLCGCMRRDEDMCSSRNEGENEVRMFGSDEEVATIIPTQFKTVAEGSGSLMVSEFKPPPDIDYLQELLAIQQQGPRAIGFFGTRNMGFMHQQLIEILSYAMVITKNHIFTSGASGTNAAVIRGALRAEKPELLTVILPQSLKMQSPESQELLSKVKTVIEKPHNDHLPLIEASRLCNMDIISHVQQVICFAFHDSKLLMETCQEAKNLRKIVTLFYLD